AAANPTMQPAIGAPRYVLVKRRLAPLAADRVAVRPLRACVAWPSEGCRTTRYNSRMNWQERILINPAVRSGKPCVKGTRITVYDVLEYLAGGMSEDEILKDFPDLTREDIRACLAFAAARERRLVNSVA